MAEAIDTLHELESRRLDAAQAALVDATRGAEDAERTLADAEGAVVEHDVRLARTVSREAGPVSAVALQREDAYRRDMRARRVALVDAVRRALDARESANAALTAAQQVLAEVRARVRAIDARIEARDGARRRAVEAKAEEDAAESRRR